MFGDLPEFKQLAGDHARFHACCAEAIDAYHNNEKQKLDNLMDEISNLSDIVIGKLENLKTKI